MKESTHPTYHDKASIACVCGVTYTVGSTKESMSVEICRACHPFFTGQEKIMDTAGRVEKFKARRAKAAPKANLPRGKAGN
jgi:large subunit ribosomal protein L31